MICGSGGSKSRLAKAAGAEEPAGQKTPKSQCPVAPGAGVQGERILGSRVADVDVKNVCDLSPGSGTLASTCLRMQIPYLGILRRCPPQLNVLDRQCLQYLSDSNSILYNESLSELIQEHFAETLTELNEPDVDDASEFWWVRQQAHSPVILDFCIVGCGSRVLQLAWRMGCPCKRPYFSTPC